jgi:hypothetical protein
VNAILHAAYPGPAYLGSSHGHQRDFSLKVASTWAAIVNTAGEVGVSEVSIQRATARRHRFERNHKGNAING